MSAGAGAGTGVAGTPGAGAPLPGSGSLPMIASNMARSSPRRSTSLPRSLASPVVGTVTKLTVRGSRLPSDCESASSWSEPMFSPNVERETASTSPSRRLGSSSVPAESTERSSAPRNRCWRWMRP